MSAHLSCVGEISCVREVLSERDYQNKILPDSLGESTQLIGRDSIFDSLGLVSLIVAIEENLAEDYGIIVTIETVAQTINQAF